ncbi:hypothetical protein ABZ354_26745 [Streptomyces sp. NPDC005925]|uniref:hypothetical protein n=1 Tax=Streptomyces sp. NPDC005925 TaxID=3157172 RepID=UPI0033E17620
MRPEHWHLTEEVDDVLTRAGGFLRSRPGRHVMQLTWAGRVRARGTGAFGTEAPVFGVLEEAGEVRATFCRLPPRGLGLSPLTPGQADSLPARLAALGERSTHRVHSVHPVLPRGQRARWAQSMGL